MKKTLVFGLVLCLLSSFSIGVDAQTKPVPLTNKDSYKLLKLVSAKVHYFETIPQNPNLYHARFTYGDADLTELKGMILPNTPVKIRNIFINDYRIPVFTLEDGRFVEASRSLFYDDQVLSYESIDAFYRIKKQGELYAVPYTLGAEVLPWDLMLSQQVHVIERAKTAHGTYLHIEGKGWIDEIYVTEKDNRMKIVQDMLSDKYQKDNLAIYVEQLETGQIAGINQKKVMYSASISKLPLLYYVQEKINQQELDWSTGVTYSQEVNDFKGAYIPDGSGNLPKKATDKTYTVEQLTQLIARQSDNVATNIIGYHVANQYKTAFQKLIRKTLGASWNMTKRQVSAEQAGQLMAILYRQNGQVLDYLSQTVFDKERISRDISVRVAHKIGDAYDFKHDVAIIYADSGAFVLSIFTENATYDDISDIANDVYQILK